MVDKLWLQQQVLQQLDEDLLRVEQAARFAHETATHEENIAENKYDTLGLEASYLAAGQARRAEALRQAISQWRQWVPQPYNESQGIRQGALVWLADAQGQEQLLFVGPEGGSMKLSHGTAHIQVISHQAPLAQVLWGKCEGDEVALQRGAERQQWEVVRVE